MAIRVRRREFIFALGSAATWPLVARAQQQPVIGFINAADPKGYTGPLSAFLKGLGATGYVEGRNVAIEYRWAKGRLDQLPALAADLVHHRVAVIAATSTPAALAVQAATKNIPIVFETAGNPVELKLVASLNRPGGNITGVTQLNTEITPKLLEVLHEALPAAKVMAVLVNPADPALAEPTTHAAQAAARALGLELHVLNASTESEFEGIFASLTKLEVGALAIGTTALFTSRAQQLGVLAARYAVPTVYKGREFAAAGGLMSYGTDTADAYRLTGVYTGRILKGDKPANLPVQQSTKAELIINLKVAKALGITFPNTLLGRADDVIE